MVFFFKIFYRTTNDYIVKYNTTRPSTRRISGSIGRFLLIAKHGRHTPLLGAEIIYFTGWEKDGECLSKDGKVTRHNILIIIIIAMINL